MAIASGFKFWNANDPYDWNSQLTYYGSPVEHVQANDDQSAAFLRKITNLGYGGIGVQDDLVRSLLPRFQQGYGAAKLTNPELDWERYLDTSLQSPDQIKQVIAGIDPASRGINPSLYVGGARWLKRQ